MRKSRTRILVVDDERFFREAIEETLRRYDFQCDACEDGETALEWIEKTPYAVVVLDICMPGQGGVETLRALHESHPEIKVIMLSASTDQELVLEALRIGAFDYLAKPLHDEELILSIRRAVSSHATLRAWEELKDRLDLLADRMEGLCQIEVGGPTDDAATLLGERAASVVAEILGARKTSLLLLNDNASALEVASFVGRDISASQVAAIPRGHGVAWVCLQEGRLLCVDDIHADERFGVDPAPGRYDRDAFMIAPLESGGRHLGILCATDRIAEGGFSRSDVALMRVTAAGLAELLARESAPDRTREPEAESIEAALNVGGELDATTAAMSDARLGAIGDELGPAGADPGLESPGTGGHDAELAREICDAMTLEIKPERVLGAALRALERGLGADPVGLFLFSPESGALELEAAAEHGLRSEPARLAPDKGLSGMVFQTGHLVATNEPASDPRFDFEADCPEDGRPGPLLCVPLRLRGKVVGLCRMHLPEALSVSASTGEVLVSVLSAAVRNVLLYRSLLESIEEVAVVRREARR